MALPRGDFQKGHRPAGDLKVRKVEGLYRPRDWAVIDISELRLEGLEGEHIMARLTLSIILLFCASIYLPHCCKAEVSPGRLAGPEAGQG